MCEIEFVYALNEGLITEEELKGFARMLEKGSFTNNDGFGVFNDNGMYLKKPEEFKINEENIKLLKEGFLGSKFLVGHARMGTKGLNMDGNTHPIISGNIILVHNGIISNDDELRKKYSMPPKPKVDSFSIAWLLNKYITEGMEIPEAVAKTTGEIFGSYSVFFYHVKLKRLFYFRHTSDFNMELVKHNGKNYIVGSTSKIRTEMMFEKWLSGFPVRDAESLALITPLAETLYEIVGDGLRVIKRDLPTAVSSYQRTGNFQRWNNYGYDENRKVFDGDEDVRDYIYKNGQRFETVETTLVDGKLTDEKPNKMGCGSKDTGGAKKSNRIGKGKGEITDLANIGNPDPDNTPEMKEIISFLKKRYPTAEARATLDTKEVVIFGEHFVSKWKEKFKDVFDNGSGGVIPIREMQVIIAVDSFPIKTGGLHR